MVMGLFFGGVCGICSNGGVVCGARIGLAIGVVSEGKTSVECLVTGSLVVTTKAERLRRSVPFFVLTL